MEEKSYKEVLVAIKLAIDNYKQAISLLTTFVINPEKVVKAIPSINDIELIDAFKSIEKGLAGEFTRTQAISFGLRALGAAVTKAGNNVTKTFKNRAELLTSIIKRTKDNYFSVAESLDYEMLEKRKDVYNKAPETKNFMACRTNNKLTKQIMVEVGTNEPVLNYLTRLNSVLDEIAKAVPFKDLESLLTNYTNTEIHTKALEDNSVDNTPTEVSDTVNVIEVTDTLLREAAIKFVQNTEVIATKEDVVLTVDDMITKIVPAIKSLTASLEILKTLEDRLPLPCAIVEQYINKATSVADKFVKNEVTPEELTVCADNMLGRVVNRYNGIVKFDSEILFRISKYGRQLYNLANIYATLDSITLYGIIPDTNNTNIVDTGE